MGDKCLIAVLFDRYVDVVASEMCGSNPSKQEGICAIHSFVADCGKRT